MMPRPRLSRLPEIFWERPTDSVEVACALLIALRGSWMLPPTWTSIPLDVQGYLIPGGIPETTWGRFMIFLAVMHVIIAISRWWHLRSAHSTIVALVFVSAAAGYYNADLFNRSAVPLVLGIVILELWIAWRALHDHFAPKSFPERRHG